MGPETHDWLRFLHYVWLRAVRDACISVAASLSYTALLALVPLTAIGLALFTAFPAFNEIRGEIVSWAFQNLTPSLGGVMHDNLRAYVENAGKTTGFGVLALAVTAILMLNTIQTAFDRIWEGRRRPLLSRLPIYWCILTLGPVLFGLSFSVTGYVTAKASESGVYGLSDGVRLLGLAMPFVLQTAGFWLFYRFIPTREVTLGDAAMGALVAGIMFECLKRGFGYYLKNVAGLEAIYGALAAIPAFLIWMYLAWLTALIGAEVSAALPEWRGGRRALDERPRRGDLLGLALGAIRALDRARSADGNGRNVGKLKERLNADQDRLQGVLEALRLAQILSRDELGRWHLARDLQSISLTDVLSALDLTLSTVEKCPIDVVSQMSRLNAVERQAFSGALAHWLAAEAETDTPTIAKNAMESASGPAITERT
jgi:membrane protein